MIVGIYKITNLINAKVYIGQTEDFEKRKLEHFNFLKRGEHPNRHLQAAWNKYGFFYFFINLVEQVLDPNDKKYLSAREQYWMDKYRSLNDKFGYNLLAAHPVKKHNKTTIERISAENSVHAKFTWIQIREMRDLYTTNNYSQRQLAKLFDTTQGHIKSILCNEVWKDEKYIPHKRIYDRGIRGEKHSNSKLTLKQVKTIRSLYRKRDFSQRELAKKFCVTQTCIRFVIHNKTYVDPKYTPI